MKANSKHQISSTKHQAPNFGSQALSSNLQMPNFKTNSHPDRSYWDITLILRTLKLILTLILFSTLTRLEAQKIYADKLDNIYIIHEDMIQKFDNQAVLKYNTSFKKYGAVTSIDVSDPFKILVFFRDFAQILFLDNTLNVTQGPFTLYGKDIINPSLICSSDDKSLWIYDKQLYNLIKTDENLQQLLRITDMHVLIGDDFAPVSMCIYNDFLYMSDVLQGIFVFDKYGSLSKRMHFKNIEHFVVDDKNIYFLDNSVLKIINQISYTEHSMPLKEGKITSFTVRGAYVYVLNGEDLTYEKIKIEFK